MAVKSQVALNSFGGDSGMTMPLENGGLMVILWDLMQIYGILWV